MLPDFNCVRSFGIALAGLLLAAAAPAQLVSSWSAPAIDDGNPIPNFVGTWVHDVTNGTLVGAAENTFSRALAADSANGRLYGSSGQSIATYTLDARGDLYRIGRGTRIQSSTGRLAEPRQVDALAFGNGVLYASIGQSLRDRQRNRGIPGGLYSIDPATAVATLIVSVDNFQLFSGFDFNPADGLIYAITGPTNAQSIVKFDINTLVVTTVANVPPSAYSGVSFSFNGVAVGDGKVYLTSGRKDQFGSLEIPVFDIASGQFEPSLPSPPRNAENTFYGSGAAFFDFQSQSGTPGSFVTTGAGCPQPNAPVLSLEGSPAIGAVPKIEASGMPLDTVSPTLLFGFSSTNFDLSGLGAPGCSLLVDNPISTSMLNVPPRAVKEVTIPFDAGLIGLALEFQVAGLSPSSNLLGAVLSDRGTLTIGD